MITKLHFPGEHEQLLKGCDGQLAQFFFEGHRKSAASDVFTRQKIAEFAPPPGKFLVHLVAMGTQEAFGPNRNGDGFPKSALDKHLNTFMKHGSFYRDHKNRGPKHSIGDVKAAMMNDKMGRAELLVWGDCEKAAPEYERAKMGKQSSYSMSCRVPADYCSCCDNEAPSVADYCSHLKQSMLQYIPEFKKYAFAENRDPSFFDISDVTNTKPADRTAHYLQYKLGPDHLKAASSESQIITGADWAEFEKIDLSEVSLSSQHVQMLQKIASAKHTQLPGNIEQLIKNASTDAQLSDRELDILRGLQPGSLFYELAKRAGVMPLRTFTAYSTGMSMEELSADPIVKQAEARRDQAFDKAACCHGGGDILDMLTASDEFSASFDPNNTDLAQQVMDAAIDKFSLQSESMGHRAMSSIAGNAPPTVHITVVKMAAAQERKVDALLATYGLYKLAAMQDIARLNPGIDADLLRVIFTRL